MARTRRAHDLALADDSILDLQCEFTAAHTCLDSVSALIVIEYHIEVTPNAAAIASSRVVCGNRPIADAHTRFAYRYQMSNRTPAQDHRKCKPCLAGSNRLTN